MWKKLAGVFRDFGIWAGLAYLLDRALRAAWPRAGLYVYELMCQPIDGAPMLHERVRANFSFQEIAQGDPSVARMPARQDILEQRFARGARCMGVMRKGVLLGYIWLSFGDYEEDEVRCTYGLTGFDAVFDFDLYLFPEHRMGMGFLALWHATNAYLHGIGVRGSYSRMTRFNLPSRRAHLRLGSRIVGRAVFLQLGALEGMASTLPPYAALGWGRKRPRLRLPTLPL